MKPWPACARQHQRYDRDTVHVFLFAGSVRVLDARTVLCLKKITWKYPGTVCMSFVPLENLSCHTLVLSACEHGRRAWTSGYVPFVEVRIHLNSRTGNELTRENVYSDAIFYHTVGSRTNSQTVAYVSEALCRFVSCFLFFLRVVPQKQYSARRSC